MTSGPPTVTLHEAMMPDEEKPDYDFNLNQPPHDGFWYNDLTILDKDIAYEYIMTGDSESLMHWMLKRTGAHESEFAGASIFKDKHPLFDSIDGLKLIVRVKLRFAARLVAREILRGNAPELSNYNPEAFADYFNEHNGS